MTYKLIEPFDRKSLSEGKDYGMAFAMVKKEKKVITCCIAINCCKDFMSDLIWSNAVNKPYSIYGLNYSPQNIYNKNEAYLVISIEKKGRNLVEYGNYKRDYDLLKSNYKNLQSYINQFEKRLKIKGLTKIEEIQENRYLVTFNTFWVKGTYLISLFTLLLRVGMFYKEGDIIAHLEGDNYDSADKYIVNSVISKIQQMLDGFIPEQNLNEVKSPHNLGIQSYAFPKAANLYNKTEAPPAKPANNLQPINF